MSFPLNELSIHRVISILRNWACYRWSDDRSFEWLYWLWNEWKNTWV